jgi:hypothetical protein
VPNISDISFSIGKDTKTSQKPPMRQRRIDVQGGYKEGLLLFSANLLGDESHWLRPCPYSNSAAPIFATDDLKPIYSSKKHGDPAKSKKAMRGRNKSA